MPSSDCGKDLRITEYQAADLPGILAIERASFAHPWSAEAFEAEARNPWARIRVLRDATGHVRGYTVVRFYEEAVHLLNLAVAPECRRQGWGRKLLEDVVQMAQKQGLRWVVLEVRISNQPAQRLYEAFGFRRVQRLPAYYGNEDGWLYVYEVPGNREKEKGPFTP